MVNKEQSRIRRSRKTRAKIAELGRTRLTVFRSNLNIYAQVIDRATNKVVAAASTVEAEMRKKLKKTGDVSAAAEIGKRIAEKAKKAGVEEVAFDRSGYRYHGRIKALADAARENGLKF